MLAKKLLGAAAAAEPLYIEDVFSTYLYTGNGSTQTITNGIDLAGEGGLVWIKARSTNYSHRLTDSSSSFDGYLESNSAISRQSPWPGTPPVFQATSSGFDLSGNLSQINVNTVTYASWTFRKQPKFFDVVTYTGNGSNQNIAHNLGSVPGFVVIKRTNTNGNWSVWHRSIGNNYLILNTSAAQAATGNPERTVTSTTFQIYGNFPDEGANGSSYVMYLFAHNAGGFGDAGDQNVISCGSFTTDGSGVASVSLGYEPQWILLKKTSSGAEDWYLFDSMRGIPTGSADAQLNPNLSNAEASSFNYINLTATGFGVLNQSSSANYIYIAIRRGPMKTPEAGTEVFSSNAFSGAVAQGTKITTNFPVDFQMGKTRDLSIHYDITRLTGNSSSSTSAGPRLSTSSTDAEINTTTASLFWDNTGFQVPQTLAGATSGSITWNFRRAPGFFDVVCYTGTGVARTVNHNLGVAPELMIVKRRNTVRNWAVYVASVGTNKYLKLNLDFVPETDNAVWNNTAPTSTVFSLGTAAEGNGSGDTYIAYLFASVTGVSKVGSYTGNGSSQTINMGFSTGARFFLVKRTDSTGDWWVYDSARGIVSAADPALRLNSTAAEVTSADAVDADSSGLIVNQESTCNINVNSATYIYLGIS